MSKNITVIPKRWPNGTTFYKDHGLDFDRSDYDKYEELDEIVRPLPKEHGIYDADQLDGSDVYDDCYGDPIKVITALEFIKIYDADDFTEWDKACMAFLKALDPDTLCALYYH
jgi:hypothetical protein